MTNNFLQLPKEEYMIALKFYNEAKALMNKIDVATLDPQDLQIYKSTENEAKVVDAFRKVVLKEVNAFAGKFIK